MSVDSMDVAALEAFAQRVVDQALDAGASDAEAYVRAGTEADVTVRDGAVESLVQGGPKSVGVRVFRGARSASTYATDFSDEAITQLIASTLQLAELTDPVPELALTEAENLVSGALPELDLYDPAVGARDAAEKLALARETEAAARAADTRITASGGASYGDLVMAHALASSNGFCRGYEESFASLHVQVIADDADSKKRAGSWGTFGRHLTQLESAAAVGEEAAARALRQLGARPIPTGVMPVVFDRHMASSLIGQLFSVLRGAAVERGASYLAERMGESIGAAALTLVDDPLIPRAPGSRPFDGEGHPARKTHFIDGGVLRSFALNSYSARKLGLAPTGHSSRGASGSPGESSSNLYLPAGDLTPEALIADVPYGFYCESMMGFGFNAATGDYSRGAAGRVIRDGQLAEPVSEVTVSGTFDAMWGALVAVANDLIFDRSTCAPTLRIDGMTVAGS